MKPTVSVVLISFPEAVRETVTSVLVQYELRVEIWKAVRNPSLSTLEIEK